MEPFRNHAFYTFCEIFYRFIKHILLHVRFAQKVVTFDSSII